MHTFEPWFSLPAKWVFIILLTIFIVAVSILIAIITISLEDAFDPTVVAAIKYLRLALVWILIMAWFTPNFVLAIQPLRSPSTLHKLTILLSIITEAMPLLILVINLSHLIAEQNSALPTMELV